MQRSLLLEDMYMNFKKTHDMKEMGFSKKETLETIDESLKSMNMNIKLVTEITKKIDTYNFTPEILLNYMKVMDFMYYRYLSTIAGKIVARYTKTITIDKKYHHSYLKNLIINPILDSVMNFDIIKNQVSKLYRNVVVSNNNIKYIVKYSIPVEYLLLDETVSILPKILSLKQVEASMSSIKNLGGNYQLENVTTNEYIDNLKKYKNIKYLTLTKPIPYHEESVELLIDEDSLKVSRNGVSYNMYCIHRVELLGEKIKMQYSYMGSELYKGQYCYFEVCREEVYSDLESFWKKYHYVSEYLSIDAVIRVKYYLSDEELLKRFPRRYKASLEN